MVTTPAEMMKEYVSSQKFNSTTEVMTAMKEMFKDVLQQVMESELDTQLGYEKSERISENDERAASKNYLNGYSQKTIKSQLGEVQVKISRDRNGEYEPQIIEKYNRNADGMEEKILSLYSCCMSQRDISVNCPLSSRQTKKQKTFVLELRNGFQFFMQPIQTCGGNPLEVSNSACAGVSCDYRNG